MTRDRLVAYGIIAAVALLILFVPGLTRMRELREKNEELTRKVEELKTANAALRQEKELLLKDPVYLEKVARQRLGMARDGETIYRVVPAENTKRR